MNAIIYQSTHHGNTKKLLDAIACAHSVELIRVSDAGEKDLREYDLIGFASGIAYSKYYPAVIDFAQNNLPMNKKVFFIHTAGNPRKNYDSSIRAIAEKRNCQCLGTYSCNGFDTYGPFKLIGGISKGHPNEAEIAGAVEFYQSLLCQQERII